MIGHFAGPQGQLGHFPLNSGDAFPNSFITAWNEPINMNGTIYFDQILGTQ
jgi:hypothetical protein